MRPIGTALVSPASRRHDSVSAVVRITLHGPKGGKIGAVSLDRARAEMLQAALSGLLAEDTVRRLRQQHDELDVGRCSCGERTDDCATCRHARAVAASVKP